MIFLCMFWDTWLQKMGNSWWSTNWQVRHCVWIVRALMIKVNDSHFFDCIDNEWIIMYCFINLGRWWGWEVEKEETGCMLLHVCTVLTFGFCNSMNKGKLFILNSFECYNLSIFKKSFESRKNFFKYPMFPWLNQYIINTHATQKVSACKKHEE